MVLAEDCEDEDGYDVAARALMFLIDSAPQAIKSRLVKLSAASIVRALEQAAAHECTCPKCQAERS